MQDPTERFTGRVDNYARYRPSYPEEVVSLLLAAGELSPTDVVADIGSGTGKLSELFLRNGNTVVGVEPNRAMREAGERGLSEFPGFRSHDGRAEATGLDDASVDLVVAGQAFHWFDPHGTRRELARITRPGGRLALVWNVRRGGASPFMGEYEAFLRRHGKDYRRIKHKWIDEEVIRPLYADGDPRVARLDHRQELDYDGLRGRLLSSSYAPAETEPGHEPMMHALRELFERHREGDHVAIVYETTLFHGTLHRGG
jgi:SAM-dependent methyltransferase